VRLSEVQLLLAGLWWYERKHQHHQHDDSHYKLGSHPSADIITLQYQSLGVGSWIGNPDVGCRCTNRWCVLCCYSIARHTAHHRAPDCHVKYACVPLKKMRDQAHDLRESTGRQCMDEYTTITRVYLICARSAPRGSMISDCLYTSASDKLGCCLRNSWIDQIGTKLYGTF
jgi:hypothetical protein